MRFEEEPVNKGSIYPKESTIGKRRKQGGSENPMLKKMREEHELANEQSEEEEETIEQKATKMLLNKKSNHMKRKQSAQLFRKGKKGDSDRHVFDLKPKHLNSGKEELDPMIIGSFIVSLVFIF
ncbi:hypothetical protein GEMRC1_003563 [Eukaryota sp. GEM-RC1]